MKQKSLFTKQERQQFSYGFRVMEGHQEFITYADANTSIRVWYGDKEDAFDEHYHTAVEVLLPLTGRCVSRAEGVTRQVLPGEVLLIPPGVPHELSMEANSSRELVLYEINGVFTLKEFSSLRRVMIQPIYLTADHPACVQVHGLLEQVIAAYRSRTRLRNLHCYALLLEMYAVLGEFYLENNATQAELNALQRQVDGEDAFARALNYVNTNYMNDITLDALARYVGFSRYTLSRMFRQETGETFPQVLSKRRVAMAMELLSSTTLPVTQVALQSGFNSIATFNRVFREQRGCSPSQYRQLYTESKKA